MIPYRKGRSYEYRAMEILRGEGWLCSRSAASHSPMDIVAGKDGTALLVQVKAGRSRASKEEVEEMRRWGRAFNARVEIWRFRPRKQPERTVVYGPQLKG